ncbi:MAG TPA: hypothetical protein VES01_03160 [Dermatophilaceae bacterium]|nr:hypothetical protein [Dermatophilaceae bacterium]
MRTASPVWSWRPERPGWAGDGPARPSRHWKVNVTPDLAVALTNYANRLAEVGRRKEAVAIRAEIARHN